jgi:hypothetical protein
MEIDSVACLIYLHFKKVCGVNRWVLSPKRYVLVVDLISAGAIWSPNFTDSVLSAFEPLTDIFNVLLTVWGLGHDESPGDSMQSAVNETSFISL